MSKNKHSTVPKTHINPLVEQTPKVRFNQWRCKKYGCLTVGEYYGMSQAHCRRCGKMTHHADTSICDPWELPREDFLTWFAE
jgi:hypothetical protein